MKRYLEVVKIISLFLSWRIYLFIVSFFASMLVPLKSINFLGGGTANYLTNPILWSWANFDGEHYLSIAQNGYQKFQHSFFPLYPLIINLFSRESIKSFLYSGLIISNIFLVLSLFLLFRLVKEEFSKDIAYLSIMVLLLFPTSFYFGAVYTESLFLFLTLLSFYFSKRGKWLFAGLSGSLASATRVTGIFLFPALILESRKAGKKYSFVPLLLIPFGLFAYMFYLSRTTGDPMSFYRELSAFGEQRDVSKIIFLPQVFIRYIKMLITVRDPLLYFSVVIEFISGIFAPLLLFWGYLKKIKLSYLVFGFLGYILPTFTGSFSSMPRYLLTLFPLYIILSIFLSGKRNLKIIFFVVSFCLLTVEIILFVRGYWVA